MPIPQDRTRYQQLANDLSVAIGEGRLPPGSMLPSIRESARRHKVSVNTVISAYRLLEDHGLVQSVPQSGFQVCSRLAEMDQPLQTGRVANQSEKDLMALLLEAQGQSGVMDLAFAAPRGEKLFPGRALTRLTKQVLQERESVVSTYALPPGSTLLREQITRRAVLQGMALGSEDIVLTHGATEALQLALRAVAKAGDKVGIETPTYFNIYPLLDSLCLTGIEIPTHPRTGLVVEELESMLANVPLAAVVTMPTVQNPLGCTMPIQAKRQLARLAAKYQLPVIEDTVYSDLQFGEPLQPSVRSFDEEGWVMVCGGFSKTLAPDYRLGWLEGGRFSQQIRRLKFTSSATESVLLSDTIGRYMLSGGYDRHLRTLRRIYQSNIETVRGLVASHYPEGTRATQPDGGFVLWLELPTHVHTTALFRQALELGVVFMPGELYSDSPRFINCMRIACCRIADDEFIDAIKLIGTLAKRGGPQM